MKTLFILLLIIFPNLSYADTNSIFLYRPYDITTIALNHESDNDEEYDHSEASDSDYLLDNENSDDDEELGADYYLDTNSDHGKNRGRLGSDDYESDETDYHSDRNSGYDRNKGRSGAYERDDGGVDDDRGFDESIDSHGIDDD